MGVWTSSMACQKGAPRNLGRAVIRYRSSRVLLENILNYGRWEEEQYCSMERYQYQPLPSGRYIRCATIHPGAPKDNIVRAIPLPDWRGECALRTHPHPTCGMKEVRMTTKRRRHALFVALVAAASVAAFASQAVAQDSPARDAAIARCVKQAQTV